MSKHPGAQQMDCRWYWSPAHAEQLNWLGSEPVISMRKQPPLRMLQRVEGLGVESVTSQQRLQGTSKMEAIRRFCSSTHSAWPEQLYCLDLDLRSQLSLLFQNNNKAILQNVLAFLERSLRTHQHQWTDASNTHGDKDSSCSRPGACRKLHQSHHHPPP